MPFAIASSLIAFFTMNSFYLRSLCLYLCMHVLLYLVLRCAFSHFSLPATPLLPPHVWALPSFPAHTCICVYAVPTPALRCLLPVSILCLALPLPLSIPLIYMPLPRCSSHFTLPCHLLAILVCTHSPAAHAAPSSPLSPVFPPLASTLSIPLPSLYLTSLTAAFQKYMDTGFWFT